MRFVYDVLSSGGSSPLARGLPRVGDQLDAPRRIIPARAGFTIYGRGGPVERWDHPRSRGVYLRSRGTRTLARGSSPLARGLLTAVAAVAWPFGIIPARAGFTVPVRLWIPAGWDHPRSRGVYCLSAHAAALRRGSSPLARGLLNSLAGSASTRGDHPRSRGVYQGCRHEARP